MAGTCRAAVEGRSPITLSGLTCIKPAAVASVDPWRQAIDTFRYLESAPAVRITDHLES
jgi:hypothetical protein